MANNVFENNYKQHNETQVSGAEISLKDIVKYLRRNKWLILSWGFAGLLLSTAYVLMAPTKYEARWQMQMAQFIISNSNSISNGYSLTNIEEPVVMIQRLRFPTSYPVEVQQICGMPKNEEFGEYLGGVLEVQAIKNVANAVEMKVRSSNPDQAKKCAGAIADMLVEQQGGLIDDRFAGRQEQMQQYQQALRAGEQEEKLEKNNKSELGNLDYLVKVDKLSWLRTRMDALQEEAMLSKRHPSKVTVPIMVSKKAVSPKVGLLLLLGLSFGLLIGVTHSLGRDWSRRAA